MAHSISHRLLALAAALAAGSAAAQVTPAEPFGGRPFGASGASGAINVSPAPQPPGAQRPAAPQAVVVEPGAAPVVVQPETAVVVQPPALPAANVMGAPGAAPPAVPPAAGQAGPAPAAPAATPLPGAAPQVGGAPAPQMGAPAPSAATSPRAMTAPPAARVPPAPAAQPTPLPPIQGNRPTGSAGAAAPAPAQQPVKGLPADAPQLVISGSVWSANPAQRLLIVNGQVFREGADLGSGVVLEKVQRDSAVLGFRGEHYDVFF